MHYVMSDIHGCYGEYQLLLKKINFSEEDVLILLGDYVDRGPAPIPVLFDMMSRPNVYPLMGNHDYVAYYIMSKIGIDYDPGESITKFLEGNDLVSYYYWQKDGGKTTMSQFGKIEPEYRKALLEYMSTFSYYADLTINEKRYILVHAGLGNFDEEKELPDYTVGDVAFKRPDFSKRYYADDNTVVIVGHTPTGLVRSDRQPLVYEGDHLIDIDCGCVFGGNLACMCLETGEITYQPSLLRLAAQKEQSEK